MIEVLDHLNCFYLGMDINKNNQYVSLIRLEVIIFLTINATINK